MGDNQTKLVLGYLKIYHELKQASLRLDAPEVAVLTAKLEGIVYGYETYASGPSPTMEGLIREFDYVNRHEIPLLIERYPYLKSYYEEAAL